MYNVSKADNEYDTILLVRHKERKDQLKLNFDAYDTYSTPISFGRNLWLIIKWSKKHKLENPKFSCFT